MTREKGRRLGRLRNGSEMKDLFFFLVIGIVSNQDLS